MKRRTTDRKGVQLGQETSQQEANGECLDFHFPDIVVIDDARSPASFLNLFSNPKRDRAFNSCKKERASEQQRRPSEVQQRRASALLLWRVEGTVVLTWFIRFEASGTVQPTA